MSVACGIRSWRELIYSLKNEVRMDKVSPVQFKDATVNGLSMPEVKSVRISGEAPWGERISFDMSEKDAKHLHKWFNKLWADKKKKK
jgi:hypothetical protein